jgi:hypothetical protein
VGRTGPCPRSAFRDAYIHSAAVSSLAEARNRSDNEPVNEQSAVTLPLHPQDEAECRRCAVHCEKVVYPAACLQRSCPFVYAYEEHGHTYMGCLHNVYEAEIDVEMLTAAERTREGFGAVRALRGPLPMCDAAVQSTFSQRESELGCVNPEFGELPEGSPTFRVFARVAPS